MTPFRLVIVYFVAVLAIVRLISARPSWCPCTAPLARSAPCCLAFRSTCSCTNALMEAVLVAWLGGYREPQVYLDWLGNILWPYGPLCAFVASLLWAMAWLERHWPSGGA